MLVPLLYTYTNAVSPFSTGNGGKESDAVGSTSNFMATRNAGVIGSEYLHSAYRSFDFGRGVGGCCHGLVVRDAIR